MFSVVIPLYNKAHTITKTLQTVINQYYTNFEIIIIDDGSTDNGVEVIKKNFNDPRIRIIQQENKGVSVARNKGVLESTNQWIAFLDADDEWHPEYLKTMKSLIIKDPNIGLALCAGLIQNADGTINYRIASGYEGKTNYINLFKNPEVFSHTSATIINKKVFNKTHRFIPGMNKFEDYLMSQSIALIAPVIYCGIPLTKYNGGVSGQLTQINSQNNNIVNAEIQYFNIIIKDYKNSGSRNKIFPIYLKYFLRHIFKKMIINNEEDKINKYLTDLSIDVKNLFPSIDFFLMRRNKKLAILWINITKVIWRLHRFPIVGEKINLSQINSRYLDWEHIN